MWSECLSVYLRTPVQNLYNQTLIHCMQCINFLLYLFGVISITANRKSYLQGKFLSIKVVHEINSCNELLFMSEHRNVCFDISAHVYFTCNTNVQHVKLRKLQLITVIFHRVQ